MKQMIVCPKCRQWWVDQIDKQPPGEFILVLDGTALEDFLCDSCVPASRIPKGSNCTAVSNWNKRMAIGYYEWEQQYIKPLQETEPMKCKICEKEYPPEFLHPMVASGMTVTVDPECALELRNAIHGMKETKFQGSMAQQMLEDFRAWRKKHDK